LVAEVGNFTRFANPRQLLAYVGPVPSESSSSGRTRRGGITKAGNHHARRVLIEGAWTHRFAARVSHGLHARNAEQPKEVRAIAWKAKLRLCGAIPTSRRRRQAQGRGHHRRRSRDGRVRLGDRLSGTTTTGRLNPLPDKGDRTHLKPRRRHGWRRVVVGNPPSVMSRSAIDPRR
jgi:hypothetical protein